MDVMVRFPGVDGEERVVEASQCSVGTRVDWWGVSRSSMRMSEGEEGSGA